MITNLTPEELNAKDYSNAEDQLASDLQGINYITYQGYDWAWASPVNKEEWQGNILYAPEVQDNWRFADETLLDVLKNELTIEDFKQANGELIKASEFFNSLFTHVDEANFLSGYISSEWTEEGIPYEDYFSGFETFYVRDSSIMETPAITPTHEKVMFDEPTQSRS